MYLAHTQTYTHAQTCVTNWLAHRKTVLAHWAKNVCVFRIDLGKVVHHTSVGKCNSTTKHTQTQYTYYTQPFCHIHKAPPPEASSCSRASRRGTSWVWHNLILVLYVNKGRRGRSRQRNQSASKILLLYLKCIHHPSSIIHHPSTNSYTKAQYVSRIATMLTGKLQSHTHTLLLLCMTRQRTSTPTLTAASSHCHTAAHTVLSSLLHLWSKCSVTMWLELTLRLLTLSTGSDKR